jgi:peptidoglycan hydrolase-like protein with peptidoglycan-binding domain
MNKTKPSAKKQKKKKLIVTTLAVGATGILGYFGWQYLKKKKQAKNEDINSLISKINEPIITEPILAPKPKVTTKKTTYNPSPVNDGNASYPLKKGSKGESVKKLQEALIAKYGSQTLPKYGADGDFGSETVNALIKLGLPTTITESTFNVIAQGIPSINPSSIGKELYNAAIAKDLNKTIALLKKLKTVDDYTAANEQFKLNRINGVRQTIVNGLLNTFSTESQKQKIKFEFLRIGLQFDGNKWSLSGIDGLPIMTALPATVWVNATDSVKVPARMVLGNEVSKRLDYTLFENKGKYFLVQSKYVKYL